VASLVAVTAESRKALDTLTSTTGRLTEVLGSGQSRGQWGERMAEDILRVAGFIEGVQYRKNHQLEGGTGRPDFTFLLPEQRVLHMDVKFPLAAYLRYLEAAAPPEQEVALREFLRDARARIREVTSRDYIDPAGGTLDYVLLFIPNEQVYGFLHERDPDLLDGALNQRVVLCSPFTLFAVLAVIRQAIDNFHLSQRTDQILEALGGFNKQWGQYKAATERVARGLESTQRAFEELTGRRTRVLDRQVDRVERLRIEAGLHIELPLDAGDEQLELGIEPAGPPPDPA
jgi:DNA recombination protein RmuC